MNFFWKIVFVRNQSFYLEIFFARDCRCQFSKYFQRRAKLICFLLTIELFHIFQKTTQMKNFYQLLESKATGNNRVIHRSLKVRGTRIEEAPFLSLISKTSVKNFRPALGSSLIGTFTGTIIKN